MSEQDDTIRLEGRYLSAGHEQTPLTLRCQTVTFHDAVFKETRGASGDVMRSVTVQPSLVASGLPADFEATKGDWTHVVSSQLPTGEAELIEIMRLGGDSARFTVKYGHWH